MNMRTRQNMTTMQPARTLDSEDGLATDIRLDDTSELGSDLRIFKGDIDVLGGGLNLGQALSNRLRTIKGELSELGHPDYGSELFEFIGQPNDRTTRARMRLAIRDAIRLEPRVKEIVSIKVEAPDLDSEPLASGSDNATLSESKKDSGGADYLNWVNVRIVVIPSSISQDSTSPVEIAFPFNLGAA